MVNNLDFTAPVFPHVETTLYAATARMLLFLAFFSIILYSALSDLLPTK